MELLELKATIRKSTGKGTGRKLRAEGEMPGILYGPKIDPLMITVVALDLEKVLKKSGQAPLSLAIENGQSIKKTAIVKELQKHPVSNRYLHVDFYEVAMDQKLHFKVPVEVVGKSPGVGSGGSLQIVRRELDVFCLPSNIPNHIEVDISALEIGDSIHVEDIPVPADVEISAETNFTVITVTGNMPEEVGEEGEGAEGAGEGGGKEGGE